jgi:hypothetical protein
MRLKKARVQKYRSIVDSGDFNIEEMKTILVGPNEAGKSALLQALQQLNAPPGIPGFHPLRDYPPLALQHRHRPRQRCSERDHGRRGRIRLGGKRARR